jgi:gamma-glutamyltranspeptidase/glutathione hydrolase
MLRAGGNATDSAVAAAFAQGVVDPIYCGIAGGFHGIFHDAERGVTQVISAGGRAPSAVKPDMWRATGQWGAMWMVEGNRNRLGYQASMVPGFVRGAHEAFVRFGSGKVDWHQILEPAIRFAMDGFDVYPYLYRLWMPRTDRIQNFLESEEGTTVLGFTDACREIYLHEDGTVFRIGERLVQTDYGRTLERLALNGPDEFYEGETAHLMAEDFQRNGGLITLADLSGYRADVREPLRSTFRDLELLTEPAPTVGPVTVEILNVLEGWDLKTLGWNSPTYLDRLARAMNAAFIDRLELLGDPDFVEVDQNRIVSKEYAAELRDAIERDTSPRDVAVTVGHPDETTHVSVMDAAGNAAAITHSLGMSSGVVHPGLGFQQNCHMVMFDPVPGRRNSIAPGKRPITGGGPVLFMRDGSPYLVIGSPAGSRKVTAIVQALLNIEDFGMDLQTAVAAQRIHVENEPMTVIVEPHFDPQTLLGLARLGHRIEFEWYTARLVGVVRDPTLGTLAGGSDPRGDRGLAVVASDEEDHRMNMPSADVFAALAADRGLELSPERLEAARTMHVRFRHELQLLRSTRLEYLPPYIEPETAVRWIENGGHSE